MLKKNIELRKKGERILKKALLSVDPYESIKNHLMIKNNVLRVLDRVYELNKYRRVIVIGAGKACCSMSRAIEEILENNINYTGIVITKYNHTLPLKHIKVIEASHPIPDENSLKGTKEIINLLNSTNRDDLVICLISGGTSAFFVKPVESITFGEKQELTKILLRRGLNIHEINTVRKHISQVKGGKLSEFIYPSESISLILSDVIGDDIDTIGSGPTVPDKTTFKDVYRILKKYDLMDKIPESIKIHIEKGMNDLIMDTPKSDSNIFENTYNIIIGSNLIALISAKEEAINQGFKPLVLSSTIEGETKEVAGVHMAITREILTSGNPLSPPVCIISGGETTVTVKGEGIGGRNQEFVLACVVNMKKFLKEEYKDRIVVISVGTDGTDGFTSAAGAMSDGYILENTKILNINPDDYLSNNDSYNFFKKLNDLIITGPTNTNVADIRLILIN